MQNYAHEYLDALESLLGRREDRITRVPNEHDDGLPHVYALFFDNWPRPRILSAFTLGLGLGLHVASLNAHVELVVSMETTDPSWGAAVAFLGEQCRAHVELEPGATLDMKESLAEGSSMSGFMVTRPTLWPESPILRVADRRVVILEARTLYPAELALARGDGREAIRQALTRPNYDPRRPPIA